MNNKNEYKISLLLTIYQVESYLEECLDSILGQSYNNIEVICVNNGSKDNCSQILAKYEKKDQRIKVVSLAQNKKLCTGRNCSLDAATGDYVLFIDPDDIIGKNYVSFFIDELNKASKISSTPINLVMNINCADVALKDEKLKNCIYKEDDLNSYGYFKYSSFYSKDNCLIDKNDITINPHWETVIPMWGRLYNRKFLLDNSIRFIDGEMIDNIPFTYILWLNIWIIGG